MKKFVHALAMLVFLASIGCGDSPVAPTPTPDTAGAPPVSVPAEESSASQLCAHVKEGVSCQVQSYAMGKTAVVLFTNNGSQAQQANLSVYKKYRDGGFASQTLFVTKTAQLSPGQSAVLSAEFPGCASQVDAYIGEEISQPPHPAEVLLGAEQDNRKPCTIPVPPGPKDVCPNLPGHQDKVPDDHELKRNGRCEKKRTNPPSTPTEPPPAKECPANLDLRSLIDAEVLLAGTDRATARLDLTNVPKECEVLLSLVSYQKNPDCSFLPQKFVDGVRGNFRGGQVYDAPFSVRILERHQTDLLWGDFKPEDLTWTNFDDYNARTMAYLWDMQCNTRFR